MYAGLQLLGRQNPHKADKRPPEIPTAYWTGVHFARSLLLYCADNVSAAFVDVAVRQPRQGNVSASSCILACSDACSIAALTMAVPPSG